MLEVWKRRVWRETYIRRISAQMPVVHVVQRNVKERTADTPLILVNFFWGLRMLTNLHSFIFHHQWYFSEFFTNTKYHGTSKLGNPSFFSFSLSFLGIFLCFLLYSHNHENRALGTSPPTSFQMRYVFVQKGYVFSTLPWPRVMLLPFFLSLPHHYLHWIPMFPSCFCITVLHIYVLLDWKSLISCGLRSQRKNSQGRCTIGEYMHTKFSVWKSGPVRSFDAEGP